MKEFEKIVIGKSSVPALIITVVLMIAVPIALFIYWRRKHKEQTTISYHCSNIGLVIAELEDNAMDVHEMGDAIKLEHAHHFEEYFNEFQMQYLKKREELA